MVFVKTIVYHAMDTLMPYTSEDPPRLPEAHLPDRRLPMPSAFSDLNSLPVGKEAFVASPNELNPVAAAGFTLSIQTLLSKNSYEPTSQPLCAQQTQAALGASSWPRAHHSLTVFTCLTKVLAVRFSSSVSS